MDEEQDLGSDGLSVQPYQEEPERDPSGHEAIITVVRSLAQKHDLRNSITQVLDVQMIVELLQHSHLHHAQTPRWEIY